MMGWGKTETKVKQKNMKLRKKFLFKNGNKNA